MVDVRWCSECSASHIFFSSVFVLFMCYCYDESQSDSYAWDLKLGCTAASSLCVCLCVSLCGIGYSVSLILFSVSHESDFSVLVEWLSLSVVMYVNEAVSSF
eukprot:GHVL01010014.1.p1 GENE.GHVL01010014.1~~GHVL01010014.1.p1  ORF type:complete len:102 (+),score=8.01 GHVL01010014.1:1083-1388(+)